MTDLKRLMLVPLACCVFVQQTDAATQEDSGAETRISQAEEPAKIINEFKRLVNTREGDPEANGMPDHLKVAHTVNRLRRTTNFAQYQMGGLIAYFPDSSKTGVRVFAGVKVAGENPINNVANPFTTNEYSHTER